MITNLVKDQNGYTKEWTDTNDNRTTKIENHQHKYFCGTCGTPENKMKFLKETGYIERTVIMLCTCGKTVRYYG